MATCDSKRTLNAVPDLDNDWVDADSCRIVGDINGCLISLSTIPSDWSTAERYSCAWSSYVAILVDEDIVDDSFLYSLERRLRGVKEMICNDAGMSEWDEIVDGSHGGVFGDGGGVRGRVICGSDEKGSWIERLQICNCGRHGVDFVGECLGMVAVFIGVWTDRWGDCSVDETFDDDMRGCILEVMRDNFSDSFGRLFSWCIVSLTNLFRYFLNGVGARRDTSRSWQCGAGCWLIMSFSVGLSWNKSVQNRWNDRWHWHWVDRTVCDRTRIRFIEEIVLCFCNKLTPLNRLNMQEK